MDTENIVLLAIGACGLGAVALTWAAFRWLDKQDDKRTHDEKVEAAEYAQGGVIDWSKAKVVPAGEGLATHSSRRVVTPTDEVHATLGPGDIFLEQRPEYVTPEELSHASDPPKRVWLGSELLYDPAARKVGGTRRGGSPAMPERRRATMQRVEQDSGGNDVLTHMVFNPLLAPISPINIFHDHSKPAEASRAHSGGDSGGPVRTQESTTVSGPAYDPPAATPAVESGSSYSGSGLSSIGDSGGGSSGGDGGGGGGGGGGD